MINRKDPLVDAVKSVMRENEIRREVEKQLNEHLGIFNRKELPHEYHASYDKMLAEAIEEALSEGEVVKLPTSRTPEEALEDKVKRFHDALIKYPGKKPISPEGKILKIKESVGSIPKTDKEKELASKHGDPNRITKGDVLKARGVKLDEKISKDMSAGEIISDFVKSDDPKFEGKSKKERTKMALGAYYGLHPEKSKKKIDESSEVDDVLNEIAMDLNTKIYSIFESGDAEAYIQFMDSLTEEQLELLGLNEQTRQARRGPPIRAGAAPAAKAPAVGAAPAAPAGLGKGPKREDSRSILQRFGDSVAGRSPEGRERFSKYKDYLGARTVEAQKSTLAKKTAASVEGQQTKTPSRPAASQAQSRQAARPSPGSGQSQRATRPAPSARGEYGPSGYDPTATRQRERVGGKLVRKETPRRFGPDVFRGMGD